MAHGKKRKVKSLSHYQSRQTMKMQGVRALKLHRFLLKFYNNFNTTLYLLRFFKTCETT